MIVILSRPVRWLIVALLLLIATVAGWDGSATWTARFLDEDSRVPLRVRVDVTGADGGHVGQAVTDSTGRVSIAVPFLWHVTLRADPPCHDRWEDTVWALPWLTTRVVLLRNQGGAIPTVDYYCPATAAEANAARPVIRAVLESDPVWAWLEPRSALGLTRIATTNLVWGDSLAVRGRPFEVVEPRHRAFVPFAAGSERPPVLDLTYLRLDSARSTGRVRLRVLPNGSDVPPGSLEVEVFRIAQGVQVRLIDRP